MEVIRIFCLQPLLKQECWPMREVGRICRGALAATGPGAALVGLRAGGARNPQHPPALPWPALSPRDGTAHGTKPHRKLCR